MGIISSVVHVSMVCMCLLIWSMQACATVCWLTLACDAIAASSRATHSSFPLFFAQSRAVLPSYSQGSGCGVRVV